MRLISCLKVCSAFVPWWKKAEFCHCLTIFWHLNMQFVIRKSSRIHCWSRIDCWSTVTTCYEPINLSVCFSFSFSFRNKKLTASVSASNFWIFVPRLLTYLLILSQLGFCLLTHLLTAKVLVSFERLCAWSACGFLTASTPIFHLLISHFQLMQLVSLCCSCTLKPEEPLESQSAIDTENVEAPLLSREEIKVWCSRVVHLHIWRGHPTIYMKFGCQDVQYFKYGDIVGII